MGRASSREAQRSSPEALFRAMFVLAYLWKWKRFAATLILGMEGIARIGELLLARRCDLFLLGDAFEPINLVAGSFSESSEAEDFAKRYGASATSKGY